jgi:hypothetical protein
MPPPFTCLPPRHPGAAESPQHAHETKEITMKTLFIAAAATLALGIGSAFAEGGDGWEMYHMLDQGPVGFQPAKPQAAAPATENGAIIANSETKTHNASGAVVTPRVGKPRPSASRLGMSSVNYPVVWGNG